MWPVLKHGTSPLPVARPWTPPEHDRDTDPFSDYFSSPSSATSTAPIQNALFSCLGHFEHLIQTSQPSDEQMEQILSLFEEMASILSRPEAQSRQSDDHLFPELDLAPDSISSSPIASSPPPFHDSACQASFPSSEAEPYINAVQSYIESVRDSTEGLKTRFEEIKELNWIQGEIIRDLRQQLQEKKKAAIKVPPKNRVTVVRKAERKGFWAAVGEALDQVGDLLYEW